MLDSKNSEIVCKEEKKFKSYTGRAHAEESLSIYDFKRSTPAEQLSSALESALEEVEKKIDPVLSSDFKETNKEVQSDVDQP